MIAVAQSAFHPMKVEYRSVDQHVRFDLAGAKLDHCDLHWQKLVHDDRIVVRAEPAGDYYMVQLHHQGNSVLSYDGQRVAYIPRRSGAIVSVSEPMMWTSTATYSELSLSVPRPLLERHARAIFGDAVTEPVEFDPLLDFRSNCGAVIEEVLHTMLRMATGDGERVDHTVVYRALENVILGALLTKQAHNYSGLLDRSVPPADLRVVRLAEEFIEARCGDPISSPDIAQAAGVSLRTLQRTFRRYRNCTPTQFLRDCRLDRSRLMLLASGGRSLVSDVAIECGFGHMGQFSLAYRKRFGESPSQTLARSKA